MEQKERRVPTEKKETEGLWAYPVPQDQLEFQAQLDQRARGAAKETQGGQDQREQLGFLVYMDHPGKKETGGKRERKDLGGLKGIRGTKEHLD